MANKKIEKRYNDDNFMNPDRKDNPLFDLGVRFMMSKEYSEAWNKVHLFCKHEMQFRRWYNLNSIVHEDKYPKWRDKLVEIIKDIIQRQGDVNHGFSLEFSEDYKKIRKFEWDNKLINKLNKMSKIIQQVPLGDKESLYILDFNKEKEELTFRTSRIPEYKQTEKIQLRDNNICTNLYFFHQNYLVKFLKENEIWAD